MMNEHAILHTPDSKFCFPVGDKQVVLRLRVMRNEPIRKIFVIHGCKYEFHLKQNKTKMEKKYSDRLFDYYEVELILADVRFAYIFQIETGEDSYYYSEDGLSTSYNFDLGFYNFFQLPYINKEDITDTVEWMKSAVFYQIFVDRFYRGDYDKDDAYINLEWGEIPNPKSFSGGDLKGILAKLDYIVELGVNTIYLTPIFSSISNHKYDTIDYKEIDTQFGSKEDFKNLVEEAHKKGVRIVLDAVFNHCSSLMYQFQDIIKNGRKSQYYDWFFINGDFPTPENCNYECFGACEYMPKLNTSNPEVRDFLLDIACHWIEEYDIDGWRLDVSDEISHDFWRVFRNKVKKLKKDCVIIGENWHDAYTFLMGDQFDGIMNYAFTKATLDFFAFGAFKANEYADKLNELLMRNKKPINEMMLNLLDTHDTHRFFTEIRKDKNKLLAAIAIETCFVGAPCIYYGTEICMEGGYDPDSRRTFDWDESNWDMDVMSAIQKIFALKQLDILQEGDISIKAYKELFLLERSLKDRKILLVYNSSNIPVRIDSMDFIDLSNFNEKVLVSNLYNEECLMENGFVVLCL